MVGKMVSKTFWLILNSLSLFLYGFMMGDHKEIIALTSRGKFQLYSWIAVLIYFTSLTMFVLKETKMRRSG
jgi:hypothetical protein